MGAYWARPALDEAREEPVNSVWCADENQKSRRRRRRRQW